MLQVYLLYFDMKDVKIKADVLKLKNDTPEDLEEGINGLLNSTGYDFYDYSDDIAILVDDQGFFKSGNPVFEVVSEYGDQSKLAGPLLLCFAIEKCRELQRKIQSFATQYFSYFLDNALVKRKLWPVYEIIWAW